MHYGILPANKEEEKTMCRKASRIILIIMGCLLPISCLPRLCISIYNFNRWTLYLYESLRGVRPIRDEGLFVLLLIVYNLLGIVLTIMGIKTFIRYHRWTSVKRMAIIYLFLMIIFCATVVVGWNIAHIIPPETLTIAIFHAVIIALLGGFTYLCKQWDDELRQYKWFSFLRMMKSKG